MPIDSSNSPGVNVNMPNIHQNPSTMHPFEQTNSSLSNSMTSPNPPMNMNLINQLPSSMMLKSNVDSNATLNEKQHNTNSQSTCDLSKTIDNYANANDNQNNLM